MNSVHLQASEKSLYTKSSGSAIHFAKIGVCGKADGKREGFLISEGLQQVTHNNSTFVRRTKSCPVSWEGKKSEQIPMIFDPVDNRLLGLR